jgi:hypothetical protein
LEVRLDAVGAPILGGYRAAAPAGYGGSQAEAGDSVGPLLGKLGLAEPRQPNGPLGLQVVATAPA